MTELPFLKLLQLMDSQFPIGSFAHSSGLESYAQGGIDRVQLKELLEVQLAYGFGRLDLAACALAFETNSATQRDGLCQELTAWKPVKGLRETSLKLGQRLLKLSWRLFPDALPDNWPEPHQAVVLGVLGKALGCDKQHLLLAFAQATLSAQLQAATRCMSLSPEQAQEILGQLQALIAVRVKDVVADPEANFYAATPALDIRAQQQAQLYTRLFQS